MRKMISLLIKAVLMETKVCKECGRELPISSFNKHRRNKDGHQDRCRECFSKYNKKRYAANRDKYKAAVAKYRRENPENDLDTRIKACAKKPTHKNAYRVVETALRAGVIERPDVCYGCGCTSNEHRIEAHHHDYTKPLDVIWLCTPCHRRMDQQRAKQEKSKTLSKEI